MASLPTRLASSAAALAWRRRRPRPMNYQPVASKYDFYQGDLYGSACLVCKYPPVNTNGDYHSDCKDVKIMNSFTTSETPRAEPVRCIRWIPTLSASKTKINCAVRSTRGSIA